MKNEKKIEDEKQSFTNNNPLTNTNAKANKIADVNINNKYNKNQDIHVCPANNNKCID